MPPEITALPALRDHLVALLRALDAAEHSDRPDAVDEASEQLAGWTERVFAVASDAWEPLYDSDWTVIGVEVRYGGMTVRVAIEPAALHASQVD